MYGATTDELRRIATEMERAAEELDANQNVLSRTLYNVSWLGDIATTFIDRWTGTSIPKIELSTQFLREAATTLERQADEQDEASGVGPHQQAGPPSCDDAPRQPDLGETSEWEPVDCPWTVEGSTDRERGLNAMLQAIGDTADPSKAAADEFEIIKLDNGKYIVVLPGVTDLTKSVPPYESGLNPDHRSARDTDVGAVPSAGNTAVDKNIYAQQVIAAMKAYGVPPGSDVMLVGHSYGADTAMDLAADPSFNGGSDGYNVTHVLAAAYNSNHQFADVPAGTEVLAFQNQGDAIVIGERVAERGPIGGIMIPGTKNYGEGQNNVIFSGGTDTDDVGHSPERYNKYLGETDNKAVVDFATSVGQAGYGTNGDRTAHDVSMP